MITKGYKQLVDEAEAVIETLSVEAAKNLHGDENVTFVDIRDVREVKREGKVAGALHAPRGMLEFWVDPDSPYHRDVFATGNKFVLYCASAWRSALAAKALQEMGFGPVAHIGGGFTAWKEADGPMDAPE
ncbi:rhodanese-like domain-containing protein [Alphaproteobacteria bacterium]|jgi:rhodanese-related sulfurtransferase|nr:rhodanese-like domain-containing protein [Alphaproteobacteria bacterium]|tara:strand:- start:29 stop:418 length:390 start_codon:yes stop_codon:yes gene_type:complete